jgi:hypothetical protein
MLRSLHIFTLVSLAVAQPIYNLASLEPMVLVSHAARPLDVLAIPLTLGLLLPLIVLSVEWLAGLLEARLAWFVHLAIVAALAALVALPVLKRSVLMPGLLLIGLAVVAGIVLAIVYARSTMARALVTFASPCVLFLPTWFLAREPIYSLLSPIPQIASEPSAAASSPPVVMVVLDEFCGTCLMDKDLQIDAARYPNFAALARSATWYRNATTVSENTMHALPALLTGRRPRLDFAPTAANYPNNLFTWLRNGHGYDFTTFEPFTSLCPAETGAGEAEDDTDRRRALAREIGAIYLQFLRPFDLSPMAPARRSRELLARRSEVQRQKQRGLVRYDRYELRQRQFEHFIECLKPSERPTLYFLHVLLPHSPYEHLPSGKNHSGPDSRVTGIGTEAAAASPRVRDEAPLKIMHEHQLFLLQVGAVDHLIGQLVQRLRETGLYDDCLLVIVGDHGISFRPGDDARMFSQSNVADIMCIPLLIKAPGQRAGEVSDRNVESIDVLPTLADLLGLELPWKVDGSSAVAGHAPERPHKRLGTIAAGGQTFEAHFPQRAESLRLMHERFGDGRDPLAFYRIGPHPELVGQSLEQLKIGPDSQHVINCHQAESLKDWRGHDEHIPCVLSGSALTTEEGESPIQLALALSGVVQAVTRTYRMEDIQREWRATVPESAIRLGDNRLQVFVIEGQGKDLQLRPARVVSD